MHMKVLIELIYNSQQTNVKGGHFLNEDLADFDATFFNFSSETARTMDPQFRKQLETAFEAFENGMYSIV